MLPLILGLTFLGSLYIGYSLLQLLGEGQGSVNRRLRDIARQRETTDPTNPSWPAAQAPHPPAPRGQRLLTRIEDLTNTHLAKYNLVKNTQDKLRLADLKYRVSEFMASIGLCALVFCALGYGISRSPIAAALLGTLGGLLPFAYLNRVVDRRLKLFGSQLPDAISIISNSLKSGYSLLQAMDMISQELPPPMSREFKQVVRECRLNVALEDALANLLHRVKSRDLEIMVTAVLIQKQVGGNLAEVLDNINTTIRDRIRILGEVRTLTAQGKISGMVISLIPVGLAFLLYLLNPAYMRPLFVQPLGQAILGVALVLQVIGVLIVRRMINIEI